MLTKKLSFIVATVFGIGYLPIMPGTYASLLACLSYYFLISHIFIIYQVGLSFILFLIGIYVSEKVESILGYDDPRIIVIDEYVGQGIALFFASNITHLLFSFFIFRIIDIMKPFPIKRIEKIKGGLGIMLDDVIAGIYTLILLLFIKFIINISFVSTFAIK